MPAAPAALAYIAAGAQVIGTVKAASDMATGSSGFNVGKCHVHYPAQFPTNQFAHSGQVVGWDIMKFTAVGGFWDNELVVAASGYLSNDNTALVGRPDSATPNVPVNRFLVLTFDKSGSSENMSMGLLSVDITPWAGDAQIAEGSAEDPWIALKVSGRFDPVGPGDFQFSFKLDVNQFGHLNLSRETFNGTGMPGTPGMSFTNQGSHIHVTLH
jgi:hypothetical protein